MARNQSYKGSIDLIGGLRPKNNGAFPLLDAHDVQVEEDGTRLDEALQNTLKALGLSVLAGKICQTYIVEG